MEFAGIFQFNLRLKQKICAELYICFCFHDGIFRPTKPIKIEYNILFVFCDCLYGARKFKQI